MPLQFASIEAPGICPVLIRALFAESKRSEDHDLRSSYLLCGLQQIQSLGFLQMLYDIQEKNCVHCGEEFYCLLPVCPHLQ